MIETLDEVERVRDEARRLAAFRPPDEIEELAPAVARVAGCGARVVAAVIEAISQKRWQTRRMPPASSRPVSPRRESWIG